MSCALETSALMAGLTEVRSFLCSITESSYLWLIQSLAMFSPLAFPTGSILYDLSTSLPPSSHLSLAPFELYREPLAVISISDGADMGEDVGRELARTFGADESTKSNVARDNIIEFLSQGLEKLQMDFPKALVHRIAIFDYDAPTSGLPDGVLMVPSPQKSKTTTIKTLMCDMTSSLLAEMTTFAKSLQALPTIESPKQLRGSATLNGYVPSSAAQMSLASGSSRPSSAGEARQSSAPSNGSSSTTHRVSVPTQKQITANSQSATPESKEASTPNAFRKPPTTFDDITGGHAFSPSPQQPHPSNESFRRPASQDKMSMPGFGVGSIGERERNKGKGRVGVVIGSLYLLAGRWPDAIRELTESAIIARTSSDHLWHAKALDYILVCILMYAWAGMDFRVSLQKKI